MERTPAGCIQLVERVYDYGYDVRLFCKNLLEYLRNLMVIKVVKDPGQLIDLPDGEIAELKTLSDGFTQDELQQLFAILSRGEEELKRSSSPRLSLEMTLIKMATLRPLVPIAELIERMKGLEEGIGKVRRPEKKEDEKMGSLEDEKKILTSQPLNLSIPASDEKDSIFIELEEPGDTWKSFMQVVRKKRPPLASKLEHGKLIELNNSMVRIGFNNGIYLDMISKEDIKALEEMLNGYLSRSMKVVIAPLAKESKTHEPVKKEQTRQPIIEEALKVFGGRIVEEKMASN
ncbi:MAG: polymerase subunit gamma and tau [Deltaproteobacteria bacterium]|nr:polymerase subunit gamma and tau [Deltaproteobacteria bacterium]